MNSILEKTKNYSTKTTKKFLHKTANFTSKIVWVTSSIETWSTIQDTTLNIENIINYTTNWVKWWFETIKNFSIKSWNEIINFTDIIDSPLLEIPDTNESLINLWEINAHFSQIASNLWLYNNSIKDILVDPDKIENASTILISMWIVWTTFTILIPKILEKIIWEKN